MPSSKGEDAVAATAKWLAIVGNSKEAAMQSAYLPAVVAALRAANAG